jgi:hypothetical protein
MIINKWSFGKNILAVFLNITQCSETNGNDHVNFTFRIKVRILYKLKKCDIYMIKFVPSKLLV